MIAMVPNRSPVRRANAGTLEARERRHRRRETRRGGLEASFPYAGTSKCREIERHIRSGAVTACCGRKAVRLVVERFPRGPCAHPQEVQ